MNYIVCFLLAIIMFVIAAVKFFGKSENKLVTTGAGIFLALFALFFPSESCSGVAQTINSIIITIVRSIKVFGLNEDFFASEFDFGTLPLWFTALYIFLLNLLYLLAPLLTFGLILSVFSNIYSGFRLILSGMGKVYVFSGMNARSAILAEDIRKKDANAVIVFFNSENSAFCMRNRIICFNNNITEINPFILRHAKQLVFFICDDNESDNLSNAIKILNTVNEDPKCTGDNIDLHYFSSLKKSVPLLNAIDKRDVRVRRINESQNFVYNFIFTNPILGYRNKADENKAINAAIVGMGQYGEEYLRAAVWSAQDPDYKLNINVFDIRNVKQGLSVKYPELINTENLADKDEINYKVNFFDGADIFETCIEDIPEMKSTNIVLVALGNDELNFEASIYLRECFERMNIKPDIFTVMSGMDLNGNNKINITDHKHNSYNVSFLTCEDNYTYDRVMNTELERIGKRMHLMWSGDNPDDKKSSFYTFEYNYRSSIAASMFWEIRENLGMNVEENEENLRLEHWRWNAYMRSEGFRYAEERNDMAKKHNCLVPFDKLDENVKKYDVYPIRSVMDKKSEEKK